MATPSVCPPPTVISSGLESSRSSSQDLNSNGMNMDACNVRNTDSTNPGDQPNNDSGGDALPESTAVTHVSEGPAKAHTDNSGSDGNDEANTNSEGFSGDLALVSDELNGILNNDSQSQSIGEKTETKNNDNEKTLTEAEVIEDVVNESPEKGVPSEDAISEELNLKIDSDFLDESLEEIEKTEEFTENKLVISDVRESVHTKMGVKSNAGMDCADIEISSVSVKSEFAMDCEDSDFIKSVGNEVVVKVEGAVTDGIKSVKSELPPNSEVAMDCGSADHINSAESEVVVKVEGAVTDGIKSVESELPPNSEVAMDCGSADHINSAESEVVVKIEGAVTDCIKSVERVESVNSEVAMDGAETDCINSAESEGGVADDITSVESEAAVKSASSISSVVSDGIKSVQTEKTIDSASTESVKSPESVTVKRESAMDSAATDGRKMSVEETLKSKSVENITISNDIQKVVNKSVMDDTDDVESANTIGDVVEADKKECSGETALLSDDPKKVSEVARKEGSSDDGGGEKLQMETDSNERCTVEETTGSDDSTDDVAPPATDDATIDGHSDTDETVTAPSSPQVLTGRVEQKSRNKRSADSSVIDDDMSDVAASKKFKKTTTTSDPLSLNDIGYGSVSPSSSAADGDDVAFVADLERRADVVGRRSTVGTQSEPEVNKSREVRDKLLASCRMDGWPVTLDGNMLEEIVMLKVVEFLTVGSQNESLPDKAFLLRKCKVLEQKLQQSYKKNHDLTKQVEDCKHIIKKLIEEKVMGQAWTNLAQPLKVTRSVGLQVCTVGTVNMTNSRQKDLESVKKLLAANKKKATHAPPPAPTAQESDDIIFVGEERPAAAGKETGSGQRHETPQKAQTSPAVTSSTVKKKPVAASSPVTPPAAAPGTPQPPSSPAHQSKNDSPKKAQEKTGEPRVSDCIDLTDNDDATDGESTTENKPILAVKPLSSLRAKPAPEKPTPTSPSTNGSPSTGASSALGRKITSGIPAEQIPNVSNLPKFPSCPLYPASVPRPPRPILKIYAQKNSETKKDGIMLSWKFEGGQNPNNIKHYTLFAFHEVKPAKPGRSWTKVGDIDALTLPMACFLSEFVPGQTYHFIVRAVDTEGHFGEFSCPGSILLKKDSQAKQS